jgi:hypothetical protein
MPGGIGIAYPIAESQIGIALETTKGTLASAPTYMFPIKSPAYKPDLVMIPDDTLQGSMVDVYDLVPGLRYDGHGWNAFPYLDSFPLLAIAELGAPDVLTTAPSSGTLGASAKAGATTIQVSGDISAPAYIVIGSGATLEAHKVASVSGTATPYTATLDTALVYAQASGTAYTGLTGHTTALLNNASSGQSQPPSCSIWDFDGEEWRTITAAQLNELNIKGSAKALADYTTTWMGNAAALNQASPSVSYTNTRTPAPWTFTAIFESESGTSSQISTIVDWEFDLSRAVSPIPALTGTQEYFEYFANPLKATAKLTFVEQSGSPYLNAYLNNETQKFRGYLFDMSAGNLLEIQCSNIKYDTATLDRSASDGYVSVSATLQLLPSSEDTTSTSGGVSPVQITVANSVSSAYWAG